MVSVTIDESGLDAAEVSLQRRREGTGAVAQFVRTALAREIEFRQWLATFPELFQTPLQHDCFLQLALLTLEDDQVPSLKLLYRRLPHSENAVRAYLRSLANGGWISVARPDDGDRRIVALRVEPRFKEARDAYFQRLQRQGAEDAAEPRRYCA